MLVGIERLWRGYMGNIKLDILAKVTKRDRTSLVALVCWDGEKCCLIPKLDVTLYEYSNASVGKNGKIYLNRGSRHERSVLDTYIGRIDTNLSLGEMKSLLSRLRDI